MAFVDKYQKMIDEYKINSSLLWSLGLPYKAPNGKVAIDYGTLTSFVKIPHSNKFKYFHSYGGTNSSYELTDNNIATANELLLQKVFENLGFMTAQYFPKLLRGKYYVASPNYLEKIGCEYSMLGNVITSNPAFKKEFLSAGGNLNLKNDSSKKVSVEDIKNLLICQSLNQRNLTALLENKEHFQEIMTPHCYDKYVSYLLVSLFSFLNDEHQNNIIFCKSEGSSKFEDVFVFDNESTAFGSYLAQGKSFKDVKLYLLSERSKGSIIVVKNSGETFEEKFTELKKLYNRGLISPKHIDLIKDIAGNDFDRLADQVYYETGIKTSKSQLDFFKLGAEKAEDVLQK